MTFVSVTEQEAGERKAKSSEFLSTCLFSGELCYMLSLHALA